MALAANALTTYETCKAELTAVGPQIDDVAHQAIVERLVNAVSDAIEARCGRSFSLSARTEKYAPPRGQRLILRQTPVAASPAPTATVDGVAVTVEVEDSDIGFLRCVGGWGGSAWEESIAGSTGRDTLPGSAERVVSVTYTAGYVTPAQVAANPLLTRTLPHDLEQAVISAVVFAWRLRAGGYSDGERNTGIGRGSTELLPDSIFPVLDRYTRWD